MRILGIDPGYDRIGWAILSQTSSGTFILHDSGCIQTQKTDSLATRLFVLSSKIEEILKSHQPTVIGIEQLFFSKNVSTAIPVAQARGAILLTCKKAGIEPIEVTPNQIKNAITGNGRADKKMVEKMLRLQVRGIPEKALDDTIDAISCAITSSMSSYR